MLPALPGQADALGEGKALLVAVQEQLELAAAVVDEVEHGIQVLGLPLVVGEVLLGLLLPTLRQGLGLLGGKALLFLCGEPLVAGLGGGSADVAAFLRLLRQRYAPEMSPETLERIGLAVGSDMPFCIRGGTALAEGRGEILSDLPPLPPCWIVICKPDFGLPTGEMFARARGRIFQSRPDIDGMVRALGKGDLEGVAKRLYNVFEEVLPPETREEIQGLKTAMRCCGALNAAMSGSGPAVFGIFLEEEEAAAAAESLRTWCGQTFLAQPVERLDGPVV
ncbi:4-(cytidine 5'-diphospho)-2-C-methyl-D-erythritol kinase [uncultured Oscillibacter sp.]|uniref:4-(cytidine 5'-diphospho)-2-C-methyl-D-erythritol kinase n=1 Tax=uncultured Oscillibacter sp. TaxID=876091 RepID=UPI003453C01B